jgi:hypothetical protein
VNATGSYLVQLIYIFLAIAALRIVWRSRDEGGLVWKIPVILGGLAFPLLAYKGSLASPTIRSTAGSTSPWR